MNFPVPLIDAQDAQQMLIRMYQTQSNNYQLQVKQKYEYLQSLSTTSVDCLWTGWTDVRR